MNVQEIIQRVDSLKAARSDFERAWQDVVDYVFPFSQDFIGGTHHGMGSGHGVHAQKPVGNHGKSIYDSTAPMALNRAGAAMMSIVTPQSSHWHELKLDDQESFEDDQAKAWLDNVRDMLFRLRYGAQSGFSIASEQLYRHLQAFGNVLLLVEDGADLGKDAPLAYRCGHIAEFLIDDDANGNMNFVARQFTLKARHALDKFGDKLSAQVKAAAAREGSEEKTWPFVTVVMERKDRLAGMTTVKNSKWIEVTIDVTGRQIVEQRGRFEMPYIDFRLNRSPGQIYAESPAMLVMPDVKSLNKLAEHNLRASQQRVNPPMIAAGDPNGRRINLNAGKINFGMIDPATGRPLIQPLLTGGDPGAAEMIMNSIREKILQAFNIDLFNTIASSPHETATLSAIRQKEKGELMGPLGARIQEGYEKAVEREVAILTRQGFFDPQSRFAPPQSVQGRSWSVQFTSPLDRMRKIAEGEGAMRTIEQGMAFANASPDVLDNFDFDAILRGMGDINGMPARFLTQKDVIDNRRNERAAADQVAAQMDMAGQAAQIMNNAGHLMQQGGPVPPGGQDPAAMAGPGMAGPGNGGPGMAGPGMPGPGMSGEDG